MRVSNILPSRGEIWTLRLNPVKGHEQGGTRPALVISNDYLNHGPAGIAIVIPITTKDKHIRSHVKLEPPEGGLNKISFIKCEDIRSVSTERFVKRHGKVSVSTMNKVEDLIRTILEL